VRAVTAEAGTTHDFWSEMTGLMAESILLSFQGESGRARIAISAALEGASEIRDYFESARYPNVALAHLACGGLPAAWEACERALPTIDHLYNAVNINWVVHAAVAAGELPTPRRVAEISVSGQGVVGWPSG